MKKLLTLGFALLSLVATTAIADQCPDVKYFQTDPGQADNKWICKTGVVEPGTPNITNCNGDEGYSVVGTGEFRKAYLLPSQPSLSFPSSCSYTDGSTSNDVLVVSFYILDPLSFPTPSAWQENGDSYDCYNNGKGPSSCQWTTTPS